MSLCPNMECPAQRFRWIEHFVSEGAMDIRGLGERLVQLLLDHELIKDPADLYSLALDQLLALPKFQEKSANNLLSSIERSKRRPLPNVIFALGIRYVGYETAQLLAEEMGGIDALVNAPVERLEAGDGIGRKTAESIAEWAARLQTQDFLRRLKAAGVSWEAERSESSSGPLAGKCFLLTGRLEGMSRPQAEARLRDLGAKIASGMNKSVDYLIVGADPGSKLERARKLGTSIRDEEWLVKLLATGALPQDD
jgi:DNA ligase (NAD+)